VLEVSDRVTAGRPETQTDGQDPACGKTWSEGRGDRGLVLGGTSLSFREADWGRGGDGHDLALNCLQGDRTRAVNRRKRVSRKRERGDAALWGQRDLV